MVRWFPHSRTSERSNYRTLLKHGMAPSDLQSVLDSLVSRVAGARGAILVGRDGVPIARAGRGAGPRTLRGAPGRLRPGSIPLMSAETPPAPFGFVSRLRDGLRKTRDGLREKLEGLFGGAVLDEG